MIVTKKDETFILFEQHEHAKVSGVIAKHWHDQFFHGWQMRQDVEWAILQRDCAWLPLDREPIWNKKKGSPHSFMDYPMKEKIEAYEAGVDEIEKDSPYAALLCSLHYTAFFDQHSTDPVISRYISREIDRQKRLKQRFEDSVSQEELKFHFDLLRLCDNLSLYICLNEPGTPKSKENKMFKDGFPQIFREFNKRIEAFWVEKDFIEVNPFPFKQNFSVDIPYKQLLQTDINNEGLKQAYHRATFQNRKVEIREKPTIS
ncbi:DUF3891 family protein [Bacillaceae bacterium W0354]